MNGIENIFSFAADEDISEADENYNNIIKAMEEIPKIMLNNISSNELSLYIKNDE
jgi:hypothetical protein